MNTSVIGNIMVGIAGSVALACSAAGHEPELNTIITTVPNAVILDQSGSFEIATTSIDPVPLIDYFTTRSTLVPVYTRQPDGTLLSGIVLENRGEEAILYYCLHRPSLLLAENDAWHLRSLTAHGSANIYPGMRFELSDSSFCEIGVLDGDVLSGAMPLAPALGVHERPVFDYEYIPDGAPAWADQGVMESAIEFALDTWEELLVNEGDSPIYRFRF